MAMSQNQQPMDRTCPILVFWIICYTRMYVTILKKLNILQKKVLGHLYLVCELPLLYQINYTDSPVKPL